MIFENLLFPLTTTSANIIHTPETTLSNQVHQQQFTSFL